MTDTQKTEREMWLEGLKVGDEVVVRYKSSYFAQQVVRRLKRSVVISGMFVRFFLADGKYVGSEDAQILPSTEQLQFVSREQKLTSQLREIASNIGGEPLTESQLERILAIVGEGKGEGT